MWKKYKSGVLVGVALATLVFIAITAAENLSRYTILAGVTVNVSLSEGGSSYLKDSVRTQLAAEDAKGSIHFAEAELDAFETVQDLSGANYQALQALLALYTNQELDFMLLDQTAMNVLLGQGICADLSILFSPDELEAFDNLVVYTGAEAQAGPIPSALDITELPFVRENTAASGKVYFVLLDNALHPENCRMLWNMMCTWEAE